MYSVCKLFIGATNILQEAISGSILATHDPLASDNLSFLMVNSDVLNGASSNNVSTDKMGTRLAGFSIIACPANFCILLRSLRAPKAETLRLLKRCKVFSRKSHEIYELQLTCICNKESHVVSSKNGMEKSLIFCKEEV